MVNPAGALGVVILVRVILALRRGKTLREALDDSAAGLESLPGLTLTLAAPFLFLLGGSVCLALVEPTARGEPWSPVLQLVLLVVLFPWATARLVLVPLGLPRAAFVLASLSAWRMRADRRGGAVLAGAWALLRQPAPSAADRAWLERRLDRASPLGGAGVLAAGLLAAAREDLETARRLIESVATLAPVTSPRVARALAGEWLAADAAARGDWERVARLPGPRTRLGRFCAAAAARLAGLPGAPEAAWLRALWLLGPRRTRTLALLERALSAAAVPREPPSPVRVLGHDDGESLARAEALLAAAACRPRGRLLPGDLARLGAAWDAALADPATADRLGRRAAALGARADGALDALAGAVQEDLAALALAADVPLAEAGGTLGGAAARLRSRLLGEIETLSVALGDRARARRAEPPIAEWQAYLALRRDCERARRLCGEEAGRVAFPTVHRDLCELAAWLWNDRKERAIAHVMFRWLLEEARAAGDAEAVALQEKNVKCGAGR